VNAENQVRADLWRSLLIAGLRQGFAGAEGLRAGIEGGLTRAQRLVQPPPPGACVRPHKHTSK